MTSTMHVAVRAKDHANMDSLPIRFGIHFSMDVETQLFDCKDLGVDDRYKDRHHFEARIRHPGNPSAEPMLGHFVLADKFGNGKWTLVTAWRGEDRDTESYLSNTLRQLRVDGMLTPEMLLKMHPHYLKGEINNSAALVAFLAKSLAQEDIAKIRASEQKAKLDTETALAEIAKAKEETRVALGRAANASAVANEAIAIVEVQEVTIQKQADEITQLREREQKRLQAEEARALNDNSTATLSKPDTLMNVDLNVPHHGSSCTVITLGDKTKRYLKTATFDRNGAVTARAQKLIGKRVRTTCWDPIYDPGKWSSKGYFRDIYELD